ncbi:Hypothetical_protein [Hexamita inflata]|uniref:Hypothetical_protein n=1 Tax=Hexamita inflata TaxID=28002 RepID=A0AA86NLC9_9EUKA|nr:Hypothetical protein HINF_LOCUS8783 [Hexamita inflata]
MKIKHYLLISAPIIIILSLLVSLECIETSSPLYLASQDATQKIQLAGMDLLYKQTDFDYKILRNEKHCQALYYLKENDVEYTCYYFNISETACTDLPMKYTGEIIKFVKTTPYKQNLLVQSNCMIVPTADYISNSFYFSGMIEFGVLFLALSLSIITTLIIVCFCWLDQERFENSAFTSIR